MPIAFFTRILTVGLLTFVSSVAHADASAGPDPAPTPTPAPSAAPAPALPAERALFRDLESSERKARLTGGIGGIVVGSLLVAAPQFSSTLDAPAKVISSLGGVTLLLNGVKSLIVTSPGERLAAAYAELNERAGNDFATRVRYEQAFIREVELAAHEARRWNSAVALVSGALIVTTGALQSDSFSRDLSLLLGSLSVVGGVTGLLRPSATENAIERYRERKRAPLAASIEPGLWLPRAGGLGASATIRF